MSKVIIKYVNQGHCNSFAKPGRKGLLSKGSSQEKRGPLVANNTQDLHSATIEPLNAFLMAGTGIRRRNNVFDTPFVGLLQLV